MPKDHERSASGPSFVAFVGAWFASEQLYVLTAALLVWQNARIFYGALKSQTEQALLWHHPDRYQAIIHDSRLAPWSAPLDDVFIHFDFARATALGHPFEWIAGNGYSSGGTSLLYPFVLAAGYLAGYDGLNLMHWAAVVACVGTLGTLLAARRLFSRLPAYTALLAPPIFLAVGVLDWTLFSGMEVAMFLGIWGLCYLTWDELLDRIAQGNASRGLALFLGLSCAFLVASRPEAAPLVAVFAIWCAAEWWRLGQRRAALWGMCAIGLPGALIVIGHMLANHALTGSSSAAGALAKLEMHHPYMTSSQAWESWLFFLKYQFLRLSDYHFGAPILGVVGSGFLLWPLGLLSLVFERTRRAGALLWISIVIWIALVALNGQVRWQNERYSMPAVAWLLLSVAVGIGGALEWSFRRAQHNARPRLVWLRFGVPIALSAATTLFLVGQAPRFVDQVWFFGRAARNIWEQHVQAGSALRKIKPRPRRVLLSDAGAIPYVSGLPAFDLIGLGGYGHLPIASASRQGVGAAVELLQYVPASDLPDVMALYPSWWGDFVVWFGRQVDEFPVRGNVICGGASKVIYAPRWAPLLHSGEPMNITPEERVVDTVDIADVISEKSHGVRWDRPAQGYVTMKLLPDPRNPNADLWDAGRLLATNMSLDFTVRDFTVGARSGPDTPPGAALLIRTAPSEHAVLEVLEADRVVATVDIAPGDRWQEHRVALPLPKRDMQLRLRPKLGELFVFHIFAIEPSAATPQPSSISEAR